MQEFEALWVHPGERRGVLDVDVSPTDLSAEVAQVVSQLGKEACAPLWWRGDFLLT